MLIDVTLGITPEMSQTAQANQDQSLVGHLGTHFDVMNKAFPLDYTRRQGIVFDVRDVTDREITPEDVDLSCVEPGMFVAFCTGYGDKEAYGTKTYFSAHPQLSQTLIRALVERGVSIIGVDCAGIRRGAEHVPADQFCADHGAFVIENMSDPQSVLVSGGRFIAHTYPMRYTGVTGLPCRVIAEV